MTTTDAEQANLTEQVDALPKELAPQRDLWPGIEQAIAKLPQQSAPQPTNVAVWTKLAAAFAPVALVSGLWFSQGGQEDVSPEWLTPVSASYELQKRQLLTQVSGTPVLDKQWQESLRELEDAEKSLKKALMAQPQDPALMKMLNQVYQQQLMLIEKAHKPKFSQI